MAAQGPTLDTIAQCLQQTLNPANRKQAEQQLQSFERTPHFTLSLLTLVDTSSVDQHVRFAASVLFKNLVKKYWDDSDTAVLPEDDRTTIKQRIVKLMISLPTKLQLQVSDALSIIADADFPNKWPYLLPTLNEHLNPQDYHANNGILQTAHAIFKKFRHAVRTNDLFREINLIMDQFAGPYTQVFKATDELIEKYRDNREALQTLLPAMLLLIKIFYSLNVQDLPMYFEDHMAEFMTVFHKYLMYANPLVDNSDDEDEATDVEKIKAGICEVITLYTYRTEETFSPMLPKFVETVWDMLTKLDMKPKYDVLVSKAMGFLTTVVRLPSNRELFASEDTMKLICEKVILPNMMLRESDEELFEDEPGRYVLYDLESLDSDTRRRAAGDLVRAFLDQFHEQITRIISGYVERHMGQYAQNPQANWKDKDLALFLVTSISAVSLVARHGATKVNNLVDVVDFFTKHVLNHLQSVQDATHPIIKADAIKYVYLFRNQLTKEQLGVLLPLLCQHLSHPSPCVAMYAAICLERIFFIKRDKQPVFTPQDVLPLAEPLFTVLFGTLERATSAEKMAEHEYTMKLIMRTIIVCREGVAALCPVLLAKLATMVDMVSKNPSNPQFNHYMFESIAVLARFAVLANPSTVTSFEEALFPPFQYILQNDVAEFTPYAFQILSQLLSAHAGQPLPEPYKALFPPLLQPALWENSGNVPALVKLVKAYMQVSPEFIAPAHLSPVLGIFQKLLASKLNDHHAFDLLNTLLYYADIATVKNQLKAVLMLVLNRLQARNTPKYTRAFVNFVAFFVCLEKREPTPQVLVGALDAIQSHILTGLLQSVIVPNLANLSSPQDRKTVVVGYLRLVQQGPGLLQHPYTNSAVPALLIELGNKLVVQVTDGDDAAVEDDLASVDLVDVSAFQTNYSRLATISKQSLDPAPYVTDYRSYFKQSMGQLAQSNAALMTKVAEAWPAEVKAFMGV